MKINYSQEEKIKRKKIYDTWYNMFQRCYNPNHRFYQWYGKKGIIMCDSWIDPTPVKNIKGPSTTQGRENFYDDMESTWTEEKNTIDRIDKDGNYEKENCQWLSQSENTRKRNEESGNPFQTRPDGTSVSSDKVTNGTHPCLKRPDGTSLTSDRVENGTNPFSNVKYGKMNKGRIYINNGIISKSVYPEQLQQFLSEGWTKGSVKKVKVL